MGLYEDLQNDIKAALETDLNDAYKTFTVTKKILSVYNPTDGSVTDTEISNDFNGVIIKENDGDVIDNNEELSSFDVLVMDSDKPFDFVLDQKITYVLKEYKIVGIVTDPVHASWILQCIAWN